MDFIFENAAMIATIVTAVCGALVSIVGFVKSLKSEKRTITDLDNTKTEIEISREGIFQALKDAVVTKDVKVSVNKQVAAILDERLNKIDKLLAESEAKRTEMTYWCLKILHYTAANNQLTSSQQDEINELLANIAEDEQIVDTGIL